MDTTEAKLILSAYRPGRDDQATGDDSLPDLGEALASLETNPELARWFADQSEMDETLRAAFEEISPPPDLRERILASSKITPFPSRATRLWLAAAACVLLGLSLFPILSRQPSLSPASLEAQIPGLNALHHHDLASKPGQLESIRTWLTAHGGAADFHLPSGLTQSQGVACEVTTIDETKVTILCFHLGDQGVAHLYIVNRSDLKNPPGGLDPTFRQRGGTAIASWSQDDRSYFLSKPGDIGELRQLL